MLNPLPNGKIQGFFKAFECFSSTFQGKQPIIALYFESENELEFYNLEARHMISCYIRIGNRGFSAISNQNSHIFSPIPCLFFPIKKSKKQRSFFLTFFLETTRVKTSNFGRFFAVSLLQHGLCFTPDMSPS